MSKASRSRPYWNVLFIVFTAMMLREAMSWMWTPRYKHVRVGANGQKQIVTRKPWYKILARKKPAPVAAKPR
jgi:hypothetical protein